MPLPETSRSIDHRSVELDGVRYVILRESIFETLCRQAGVEVDHPPSSESVSSSEFDVDQPRLRQKLGAATASCRLIAG